MGFMFQDRRLTTDKELYNNMIGIKKWQEEKKKQGKEIEMIGGAVWVEWSRRS